MKSLQCRGEEVVVKKVTGGFEGRNIRERD
jgi:hypothetical protein